MAIFLMVTLMVAKRKVIKEEEKQDFIWPCGGAEVRLIYVQYSPLQKI
jgi:hypothetical protein